MKALLRLWIRVLRWLRPPLGRRGETLAARHLKRLGYLIVAKGRRSDMGELDLVAVDGRTVVFVEVKTRRSDQAGAPAEAVTATKQRRLARLALAFLRRHDLLEHSSRFDVIAITWPLGRAKPILEHIQNAFEPPGKGQMFT